MAPIKFEEHIKDKLEQRKITPSSDAWSKLSQQLDAEERKTKKSVFWWIGIAASIAALVMISFSYFDNISENETQTIIVKETIENNSDASETSAVTEKEKSVKEELVKTKKDDFDLKTEKPAITKPNGIVKEVLAKTEVPIKASTTTAKIREEKSVQLISTPEITINSVIAELQLIKSEAKNTVTDQQIDSLLKIASQELLIDKAIKSKSVIVDADALLQDVEEEMGQSFRTRIYETLKDNFKRVKSAVAQRNE